MFKSWYSKFCELFEGVDYTRIYFSRSLVVGVVLPHCSCGVTPSWVGKKIWVCRRVDIVLKVPACNVQGSRAQADNVDLPQYWWHRQPLLIKLLLQVNKGLKSFQDPRLQCPPYEEWHSSHSFLFHWSNFNFKHHKGHERSFTFILFFYSK